MRSTKLNLAIGIIAGAILTFFCFNYFAPRYEIKKVGLSMVKFDKWTGQSWRFVNNNWKKVVYTNQEWKQIDQAVAQALNIQLTDAKTESTLNQLREKYAVLRDIPDDELLERIKWVYSKHVLTNLYLSNFLNSKPGSKEEKSALGLRNR